MNYWINRASASGYVWEGCSLESAEYPCSRALLVPVAGGHHRFKIEINSLNDLINLQKEVKECLIIGEDSIIIYDDYVE